MLLTCLDIGVSPSLDGSGYKTTGRMPETCERITSSWLVARQTNWASLDARRLRLFANMLMFKIFCNIQRLNSSASQQRRAIVFKTK